MLKTWPKPKANRDSRLESPGSLLFKQPLWHFRIPGFAYPKVVPTGFFSWDFFHSWRTWDCRTGLRYRVCASKGSSNRWEGAPWVVTIALIDGYSHIYIFWPWNKSQSTFQHTYLPHTYMPTYLQPYIPAYLHADILTYLHTCSLSYMKVNQNPLYSLSLAPISPIPLTWQMKLRRQNLFSRQGHGLSYGRHFRTPHSQGFFSYPCGEASWWLQSWAR